MNLARKPPVPKYRNLSPAQRAMVDDGCPIECMATPENTAWHRAWYAANPPTVIPFANIKTTRDESPETKAFRAQEEECKRLKSLAGISRMKVKFASKAIDYSKMRWDARRNKFVPIEPLKLGSSEPLGPRYDGTTMDKKKLHAGPGGGMTPAHQLTKDNAEAVARLNGVWKDSYEKLRGTGRIVMTVGNVLKGIVKRGGAVKWQ